MATNKKGIPKPNFLLMMAMAAMVPRTPMVHRLSLDFKGMVFPSFDFDFLARSK